MADSGRDEHAELIAFLREQEEARQRFIKKQVEKRPLARLKYDEAKKNEELKREIEEYDRKMAEERARAPIEVPGVSLAVDDEPLLTGDDPLTLALDMDEPTQTIGRGRKQKRKIVKRKSSKTKRKGGKRRSSNKRSNRRKN